MSEDAVPDRPLRVPKNLWESIFPPDRRAILDIAARYFVQGLDQEESVKRALINAEDMAFMSGSSRKVYSVLGPLMGCDINLLPFPHVRAACEAVGNTAGVFWKDILKSDNPARLAFQKRLWWRPLGACLICGYQVDLARDDAKLKFSRTDGDIDFIHGNCAESLRVIGKAFGELVLQESLIIQCKYETKQSAAQVNLERHANEEEDDGYWSAECDL